METVISGILGGRTVAVYGVRLEGTEGRAGMAAIHGTSSVFTSSHLIVCGRKYTFATDPESNLDLAQLVASLDHQLPKYAHPIFVRLVQHIDLTGTFKVQCCNS